jgi:hypothetical protein
MAIIEIGSEASLAVSTLAVMVEINEPSGGEIVASYYFEINSYCDGVL